MKGLVSSILGKFLFQPNQYDFGFGSHPQRRSPCTDTAACINQHFAKLAKPIVKGDRHLFDEEFLLTGAAALYMGDCLGTFDGLEMQKIIGQGTLRLLFRLNFP